MGTPVSAQARFDVLTQHVVPEISGLRVVTIRDTQLSECYALFIMESAAPSAAPDAAAPTTTRADEAAQESLRRIQEAAEKRDRQLAELQATVKAPTQYPNDFPSVMRQHETARMKIEEEYERALRAELPGTSPWSSSVPGVRTGGSEELGNAMRRAVLDPDPTAPMKVVAGQLARLDALLTRLIEEPRLAVSGPAKCVTTGATTRPEP
jgi:hypothetical protein